MFDHLEDAQLWHIHTCMQAWYLILPWVLVLLLLQFIFQCTCRLCLAYLACHLLLFECWCFFANYQKFFELHCIKRIYKGDSLAFFNCTIFCEDDEHVELIAKDIELWVSGSWKNHQFENYESIERLRMFHSSWILDYMNLGLFRWWERYSMLHFLTFRAHLNIYIHIYIYKSRRCHEIGIWCGEHNYAHRSKMIPLMYMEK